MTWWSKNTSCNREFLQDAMVKSHERDFIKYSKHIEWVFVSCASVMVHVWV